MTVFFSQLINGLSLGSIYALIALGYSMVYGIILLLNFAHGDVIMVGAYMSWFVMNQLGLGPVTAVCATIITCTLLGVVIEKVAYTPLRNAPRISLLITAIGVSFFLEYTAELVMGSGAKVIPSYYGNKTFMIGSVPLGLTSVITLIAGVGASDRSMMPAGTPRRSLARRSETRLNSSHSTLSRMPSSA